jgi:glycine cleavage system H protein
MSNIPRDLRYTKEHGWVRSLAGQVMELGITDHGQEALGDLVSVELPEVGRQLVAGENYVTLESTKTAFEVACPLSGKVSAVNIDLKDAPDRVNQDPYGKGWLVRLQVDQLTALSALLDASAYETVVNSEEG